MEFPRDTLESLEHVFELLRGVGRHVAGADDGLAAAHRGINGWRGDDTVVEQTLGEEKGFLLVADEDGDDRGFGRPDVETEFTEAAVHAAGVLPEFDHAPLLFLHDLERF